MQFVDVDALFGAEDGDDQRQPDGHFRRRDGNHEKDKHLSVNRVPLPGERDSARFAALSMSSTDINTRMALRRSITPIAPMMNKTALRMI